jgi:hypothetical protein
MKLINDSLVVEESWYGSWILILIKLISSIIYNMSWKYFLFECNFFFQYMLIFMYMLSLKRTLPFFGNFAWDIHRVPPKFKWCRLLNKWWQVWVYTLYYILSLTSAPQVHSRVSNINFDILIFRGHPMHIPWKLPKDGKVLSHLGLTNLSVWVGFCPSSPQQGIKYFAWDIHRVPQKFKWCRLLNKWWQVWVYTLYYILSLTYTGN